ncbi:ferredoxin [Nonomuraea typhae]|uniref:ferredoxin n=1 Tax=Nonomuraea typhae TaxID=2603600 RepID=UPI0012F77C23|nr:ferredoxin [Nonomuraea typhae]
MKVHIDSGRCQGHGRCYDLSPEVFAEDDEGYGQVLEGGLVAEGQEHAVRLAVSNCPERAIAVQQEV